MPCRPAAFFRTSPRMQPKEADSGFVCGLVRRNAVCAMRFWAGVGLLGQVVGQIDRRLDCLGHAEPMLENKTREIARIDAPKEVVTSRYGRVRPGVVDKAGGVEEAGSLDGRFPEPAHALRRVQEPPGRAKSD